jgi:hypothetical protein
MHVFTTYMKLAENPNGHRIMTLKIISHNSLKSQWLEENDPQNNIV